MSLIHNIRNPVLMSIQVQSTSFMILVWSCVGPGHRSLLLICKPDKMKVESLTSVKLIFIYLLYLVLTTLDSLVRVTDSMLLVLQRITDLL